MTEDDIRQGAREAGERLKKSAVVMIPQPLVPYVAEKLADIAVSLQVTDDGEDDGIPVLSAVSNPGAILPAVAHYRFRWRLAFATFLIMAVFVVVGLAGHDDFTVGWAAAFGAMAVVEVVRSHKSMERRQALHDYLVDQARGSAGS